jgi:hypothetical protein
MPVHRKKTYLTTGLSVSVKNRRKRLKIIGGVFTAKKKGAHGGRQKDAPR